MDEREPQRLYYCALCYLQTRQEKKAEDIFRDLSKNHPGTDAAKLSEKYLLSGASNKGKSSGPPRENVASVVSSTGNQKDGVQIQLNQSVGKNTSQTSQTQTANEPDELAIPFRRTSKGQLEVTAELKGRSMRMIFDTGAEECLFGKNQISAANLSNADRSRSAVLHSVSGPMSIYQIRAELKLGTLKKLLPVCVQDSDMEAGILGQPFLKGYGCTVDSQAGLIRLRKTGTDSSAVSYDSFAIPFKEVGDKLIVSAKLNGRNTDMCFDTGAFGVCLSKGQAEKLGIKLPDSPTSYTNGPNGRQAPSWDIRGDVALGPINKQSCPIRVIESETSYPLLGQNFYGERTYKIDRGKKEIRFAR